VIYAVNLMIMLGWAVVTGDWSSPSLLFGFAVGFGALWVARGLFGDTRYHARTLGALRLLLRFLYELWVSSVAVARAVLARRLPDDYGFVEMPLDARTDAEIVLTANLISLTPGTLSIDVSPDRRRLLVHAMFVGDPDATVASMKDGLERPVLEALR
jgi:multicomponent Na+:H+ antiporter subunit E